MVGLENVDAFIGQLNSKAADFQNATSELRDARLKIEEAFKERNEGLAEQRRKGEHGDDWRILQRRIDEGKTTEQGILNGTDVSLEAKAVQALMKENLQKIYKAAEEEREVEESEDE